MGLDHGHINGMCNGLKEAGANLKWVYDSDPKVKEFVQRYPEVKVAESEEQILEDSRFNWWQQQPFLPIGAPWPQGDGLRKRLLYR